MSIRGKRECHALLRTYAACLNKGDYMAAHATAAMYRIAWRRVPVWYRAWSWLYYRVRGVHSVGHVLVVHGWGGPISHDCLTTTGGAS